MKIAVNVLTQRNALRPRVRRPLPRGFPSVALRKYIVQLYELIIWFTVVMVSLSLDWILLSVYFQCLTNNNCYYRDTYYNF
jgi:hypothetical protein